MPFIHNNLAVDGNNPWRNICDGSFSTSVKQAALSSPKVSIELKKLSAEDFELKWKDSRLNISGVFFLKKINN